MGVTEGAVAGQRSLRGGGARLLLRRLAVWPVVGAVGKRRGGRLAAIKRERAKVWEALRLWALKREREDEEERNGVDATVPTSSVRDEPAASSLSNGADDRPNGKPAKKKARAAAA
jgi:hypothetical protein